MEKLSVTPNVPQQIALKYPEGKIVEGRFGDQVYFSLAQPPDTCLYLDMGPAQKINLLNLNRGEIFNICKRWTGKKTDSPVWDVWPVGQGEAPPSAPPAIAAVPDTLEQQLRASLALVEKAKQAAANVSVCAPIAAAPVPSSAQPATNGHGSTNGNGHCNGAARPYEASGIPAPPLKIPMNVAFNEALDWMKKGLDAHHVQWNDAAQQDLVSTVLIGGLREGWVGPWERGGK